MKTLIDTYLAEVEAFEAKTKEELEQFRIRYAGKKGLLNDLFADFKQLAPELRRETGIHLNTLKQSVQHKLDSLRQQLNTTTTVQASEKDLTLPVNFDYRGSRHPLMIVRHRMLDIFSRIGFTVAEGPEIEDDWHNFSALNFAPEHPAREMQDTFFIEKNPDIVLRTHTSSVQVRVMENTKPPIRMTFPGRVYRNEAISARAHCFFHQVEGLYVDKNVSFADLRQTMLHFAREMFSADTQIRLRPSYFPFTEPSAEMDISCNLCGGKGCGFCKYTGWVEILGCGMVHPNVLKNCGIDPEEFRGFAFGIGVERITNLLFNVKDLRMFSENDVRFLQQFESAW
ncbi:MAG: phenylalanine--tRNA ligase subunit alpha [Lentimicrobiaceae bacterium]|jgi:phenylalanyl-tRNA synthetase alpha chain|nr:phenylalanine--tRNA ligase subunit alpha [Lentimicrobiaceae bacterium]MDD4597485.1 phenylalanine--tRNA ligase subunit alpha [Lentimicrobiaceae bacterium]MDY0025421.1 phenylalanine--tRNA ligase subunit alpha [Lentimicrobium sp.]